LNKNKKNALVVASDNFYPAYEVKASDILEIWEYQCSIARSDRSFGKRYHQKICLLN
jgi:hypothetical protein